MDIIECNTPALNDAKKSLNISNKDIDSWECEEAQFFATLGNEQPYDIRQVVYIEPLQDPRDAESKSTRVNTRFRAFIPVTGPKFYEKQVSDTRKIETERCHAIEKVERITRELCELEVELEISPQWTPAHSKYQEIVNFLVERKYRRALDKLQKLVIQRLFKLHKLNLAQTGKLSACLVFSQLIDI